MEWPTSADGPCFRPRRRSPMTRKLNRNYSRSVVVPFIAVLVLMIAAAVLAQTSGEGQTTGKPNAVLAPAGTSVLAQAERPLFRWTGNGSPPVIRTDTKRHRARPLDGDQPLFQPAVTYSSGGGGPISVAVADVNGDGNPDVLVANSGSNTVGVLLGNGDGTFQPPVTYGSGGCSASSVAVADVNGDGKPDLLVTNWTSNCVNGDGTVAVLMGNGDGTFQTAVVYSVYPGDSVSVAVADLNGDGKPDVAVAQQWAGDVAVMLGNGDGTLQLPVFYPMGNDAISVAIADVNGDSKPDLVLAREGGGSVCVLLGNGDGTFQPAACYGSGNPAASWVAVADVNGDGQPDLAVADGGYGNNGAVGVLLGNGDGTFQAAVVYGSGGASPSCVALADVNGDGLPDLILSNGDSGNVGVLLNNTGPHTSTTTTLAALPNPSVYGQAVTF